LSAESDPLLAAYLAARDEGDAGSLLARLLDEQARPLVRRIVRGQLGGSGGAAAADLEDVESGVVVRLLGQLMAARTGGEEGIRSFRSYVAVAAYHGCHAFLRARQPERARFFTRLRYLLTHDPELALWPSDAGDWLGGLAAWRGRATGPRRLPPRTARDPSTAAGLRRAVHELLRASGGPWRLDELVEALDRSRETSPGRASRPMAAAPELADTAAPVLTALADRELLARAWEEIQLLPRRQRVALLLNLRDSEGREMLSLMPLAGLAGQAEIARVLELPASELAALWARLPLADLHLAELLGLTRRQVINLRKCARERLARRLARPAGGEPTGKRGNTEPDSGS